MKILNKTIGELKKHPRVTAAYQFGSHQTKRQNPLSDIDICLFVKDLDNQTLLDLYSYGTEKIDISIFDNLPIYIKPEVFKGKQLFVKDKFYVANKFAISYRKYQDFKRFQKAYWKTMKKRLKNK